MKRFSWFCVRVAFLIPQLQASQSGTRIMIHSFVCLRLNVSFLQLEVVFAECNYIYYFEEVKMKTLELTLSV